MHKTLLTLASIMWGLFIFILFCAFEQNPYILIALGVLPFGLFVAGVVLMMKRAVS